MIGIGIGCLILFVVICFLIYGVTSDLFIDEDEDEE